MTVENSQEMDAIKIVFEKVSLCCRSLIYLQLGGTVLVNPVFVILRVEMESKWV